MTDITDTLNCSREMLARFSADCRGVGELYLMRREMLVAIILQTVTPDQPTRVLFNAAFDAYQRVIAATPDDGPLCINLNCDHRFGGPHNLPAALLLFKPFARNHGAAIACPVCERCNGDDARLTELGLTYAHRLWPNSYPMTAGRA